MCFCPKCGRALENYSSLEGGWCSGCEEWFPPDIVEEALEEGDPYDPFFEECLEKGVVIEF